jgi:branched-chain amino acid transport system ATP-binding protein
MSVLNVEDVTMRFGGLTALSNINLKVNKGEIVGVIGPNGAGKTTLFNVVTGMYTPTEGKVFLSEKDVTGMKPYLIAREGFARTFQNLRLFGRLSVRDNVISAMSEIHKISVFDALLNTKKNRQAKKDNDAKSEELLKLLGLWDVRYELAKNLPYGKQRKLEIARAMATDPKLLLLDEPAAGMNEMETEDLANIVKTLQSMGQTILLIEHDMKFVMNICERIYVLNYGELICEGTPSVVSQNPEVIKAYLGEED